MFTTHDADFVKFELGHDDLHLTGRLSQAVGVMGCTSWVLSSEMCHSFSSGPTINESWRHANMVTWLSAAHDFKSRGRPQEAKEAKGLPKMVGCVASSKLINSTTFLDWLQRAGSSVAFKGSDCSVPQSEAEMLLHSPIWMTVVSLMDAN